MHARGQVATFTHATPLPARALAPLLNRELPRDVRVTGAAEAPERFHARHSARARRYEYRLLPAPDVLRGRYAWAPGRLPPLAALAATSAPLVGSHDYSAFGAVSEPAASPVCRVTDAGWRVWEDGVAFVVTADHFLYHMVRHLVATSLAAARTPDPAAPPRDERGLPVVALSVELSPGCDQQPARLDPRLLVAEARADVDGGGTDAGRGHQRRDAKRIGEVRQCAVFEQQFDYGGAAITIAGSVDQRRVATLVDCIDFCLPRDQ